MKRYSYYRLDRFGGGGCVRAVGPDDDDEGADVPDGVPSAACFNSDPEESGGSLRFSAS